MSAKPRYNKVKRDKPALFDLERAFDLDRDAQRQ